MPETKDTLTGLDRYEEFLKKLERETEKLTAGEMEGQRIAIIYTDIKHFKYINDTYGYQRGDALLQEFVKLITQNNAYVLCAARVYSDNIVMAITLDDSHTNSEFRDFIYQENLRLEEALRERFLDRRLRLCTGISIITKEDRVVAAETAVSNANLARKVAKELDEDCCVLFDRCMMEGIKKEVEITSYLSSAIEKGEFKVFYQPKMETTSLKIIGAEALVRWQKPDGKFVYPDEFIPVVERSGQVVEVDYFVYREVFKFLAQRLQENQAVVPISVNVSRVHLHKMGILDYVKTLFEEYQIPADLVEFELTESIYIDDTEKALQLVEGFHEMGVKVSMDDFGSGYSSLNLLSKLPIDILKLDKVFLQEHQLKKNDKIIISCVIEMAKRLCITSLCEGVETLEQSDYLTQAGCEIQQGYYFSKPVSQSDFEVFVNEHYQEKALA